MKIGIIADTHIPDRISSFDQNIIDNLREDDIDLLIHAGDICTKKVLDQLKQIAPVCAVRGNRDWLILNNLPNKINIKKNNISIGITHGHGNILFYFWDKLLTITIGYRFERFYDLLINMFPDVDVIIFGHTHRPMCEWINGKLFINPGSVTINNIDSNSRTYALMEIDQNSKIKAEIKST